MPELITLCLVETKDGTAVCVTVPYCEASAGDLVMFDGGKVGTVQFTDWIDKTRDLFTLVDSMIPIFPAESIWTCYKSYQTPDQTNEEGE